MGVPKFFRYISERYPCLSEFVQDYQIPVFDNLYLDMNGIIHMCSHPDDGNPHFRITEEKIFADIFHYVEVLFRMIKPQKVFFMAVDGVAPRAKMNQQRGRRFRSAKDAEKLEAEAVRKGEKLPEVERFDSNCITPGTEFMARLHEQLKYFIISKISTDNLWKKCKVILSGHETPGEGEHKIMDYIRYIRSQPGYDPNTRHCLYGLDADLIMLGLCTHDPHFSLLREEVKFGKKAKRSSVPEEIRFYLLHLSIMREYLELEFAPLKDKLKNSDTVKFDIEKIIDDWILMGFLVGNDFIPNLPNLHIANGALPILYKAYIEVLPTLDGYINEAGTLNLERFEKFMTKLAEIDIKNFEETQEDLYYMKCKTGRKHTAHVPVSTKYGNTENNESRDETDLEANSSRKSCIDPALEDLIERTNELDVDSDDSESNEDEAAFKCFKDEYYRNKMEYQKVTPEVMREQAEGYVRAIQWNLNYYYNGVCSWSWFYPHHYSPYISDIKGFSDLKIEFELGQPFKPYEQLLAVLPTASKNLLPKCYHHLMTDESSLIKKYYPEEFQTDLNGKRQEWEAVVLVPFIDEEVLLEAMKTCNEQLTPEEVQRNTHGPMLVYEYVSENVGRYKAPDYFPDVQQSHAYCMPVDVTNLRVPKEKLIKGAYPGALFDVYYPGFPTLKHLKYESKLKKAKVKVFEQSSRNENMILRILPNELYFEDSIPEDLLGEIVWVGWPHLVEAKVVAISNRKLKYVLSKDEDKKYEIEEGTANSESLFDSALEGITIHYRDRMGIDFGETKVLVHVKVMVGRKYVFISNQRMNLEKQFATTTSYYPLQSIVTNISVHDEYHTIFREVTDIFPVGSTCFSLTYPYYGSQGIVMESKECLKNEKKLRVSLLIHEEPDFSSVEINNRRQNNDLNLTNSASQLQISNYVFSRITGSLFITIENLDKPVNIGLDLKFNKKNQETPGYTKKIDNNWHYTNQAVNLVKKYIDKFPEVFDYLSKNNSDKIFASDVFPGDNSEEKVREIQIWLKTLPTHNVERRICGSTVLEAEIVTQIEKIVDSLKPSTKKMVLNIKPQLLYKPEIQMGNLTPDPMTKTEIFDRIVNVKEGFTVPVGLKGTVIAIHKPSNGLADETYDVVFDKPFVGGMALNCSENRGYSLSKNSFINLSHGKRFMEQKTGVPGALRALAREKQNSHNFFGISNYSNPTNVNGTQQNSAFASFNKSTIPNSHNKVNHNNYNQLRQQQQQQQQQPQLQRQQVQQKPQHFSTSHNVQNKINKNSFYYMADFTQNYGRVTKENAVDQKNTDFYCQNRRHGPSSSHSPQKSLPNNSKARTEVIDTDFLKKILKIADNSKDKSQVENSPGTSQNKESTSSITSASAKLLSYYQSNSLGCPRYTYFEDNVGICAQVALPNGKVICGKGAKSREEASEIVASDALNLLKNDQTLKQKPTTSFPAPPVKWIPQQSKLNSQVFINKSYQTKQSGYSHHQKVNSDEQHKHKTSKANNFNLNNENVEKTKSNLNANTPAFVPLQALKKKQINKPADNSKNENYGENEKSDHSKNATQTTDVKVLNVGSPKETSNKPQRHRKTRIAANFLGNK